MARECSHLYFKTPREMCATLEEFEREYHLDVLGIVPELDAHNKIIRYLVVCMYERRIAL